MDIFEWAKDKILMGSERKTAVISAETARMTAYHEGMCTIYQASTGYALYAISVFQLIEHRS
jgi:ATP-dependent Zn protease